MGTMESTKKLTLAKSTKMLQILLAWAVVAGLYAGSLPGLKWAWFSYHPSSMMVAYVGLATSAIIFKKRGGYENTKLHGMLMTAACALAGFGWYVIYSNKAGRPHLTSWHSWVGVSALAGFAALQLVGLLALHPDMGMLKTNKQIRFAHKWLGRAVTAAAWTACSMGFNKMNPNPVHQFAFAAPLLFAAAVLLRDN